MLVRFFLWGSIGVLAVAAFAAIVFLTDIFTEEAIRFKSPDGRHQLIVYRRPRLYAMPGQGSDAPGYVVLVDAKGRILQRRQIGMVQLVYQPRWTATRVKVKLIFDWPLPSLKKRQLGWDRAPGGLDPVSGLA